MKNRILVPTNARTPVVFPVMDGTDLTALVAVMSSEEDVLVIADNAADAANHLASWRDEGFPAEPGEYLCNYPDADGGDE